MNIDERIEALTHSVELLTSFYHDNRQMIVSTAENLSRLEAAVGRVVLIQERLETVVSNIAEATNQLIAGINNHETRIQTLESRVQ